MFALIYYNHLVFNASVICMAIITFVSAAYNDYCKFKIYKQILYLVGGVRYVQSVIAFRNEL